MAKISNKDKYIKQDPVNAKDYWVLTDYLTGKTKHIEVGNESLGGGTVDPTPPDGDGDDQTGGVPILVNGLWTWLKWADDAVGTNMSDSPVGKTHIGLAINKNLPEDGDSNSDIASYYFWTEIGGSISYIGADGKTYYLWVKYSNFADGTDMVNIPGTLLYIGLAYNKTTATESNDPNDYEWSLIQGQIQQPPTILYYWFKFADDINGTNMSDDPTGKTHMGIAIDKDTPIESDDPTDYTWNPITGAQGLQGPDGRTFWIWVKWAMSNTPSPSEMSDDPEGMTWMGIAIHKNTATESTDYTDYDWTKTAINTIIDQNNIIREIEIPLAELTSLDDVGIAAWLSENGVIVKEDEIIGIKVVGAEEPTVPTIDDTIDLTLTVGAIGETTAVINWDANSDTAIVRYEIFYKRTNGTVYNMVDLLNVLTTTLTGLTNGSEYEVYALGYDTLGNFKKSNVATFTTDETFVADTPNIQADAVTDTTIDLSWSIESSFGADRYELYQIGTGKIYDGANTSIHITGLTEDTTYQFYVIAFNGLTQSNDSATIDVDTLLTVEPPLTTPVLSFITSTTTRIVFSISIPDLEVDRVTDYYMEYREFGQTDWIPRAIPFSSLQKLASLNPDTSYEIRVASTDGDVVSSWSTTLLSTTLAEISAKISLKLKRVFTSQEITDGYVGQLTILDATPNSYVDVEISTLATLFDNAYIGNIEFKNTMPEVITLVTSKEVRSGIYNKRTVTLLVDANGDYDNIYRLSSDTVLVEFETTATIVGSNNGIDSDKNTDTDTLVIPQS